MDHLITEKLITKGWKSISDLVQKKGWDMFREYEEACLVELVEQLKPNQSDTSQVAVVSCGGGIIERESNRKLLRNFTTIWIQRDLEDYEPDTQQEHRPELQESIRTVYERRSIFYEEAAKHIFVYPQYEKVKKLLGNKEKYYQTTTKLFKKFVKRILFGLDHTIWAPNTFFLCIDYQNLVNLQLN